MIQLAAATVLVNDEVIAIVPNSLKYKDGKGEQNVRAASTGDGGVETVFSHDVETSIGEVMFDLYPDAITEDFIKEWKGNGAENQILITNNKTNYTETFSNIALTNKVKRDPTFDGVVSFEWKGDPAV